jgi:hypothetical protein
LVVQSEENLMIGENLTIINEMNVDYVSQEIVVFLVDLKLLIS